MKRLLLLMLALALPLAQVVRADNDKGNQKKKNKHQAEAATPNGVQQAAPKVRQPVKQAPPPKSAPTQRTVAQATRSAAPTQRAITHAPRPVTPAAPSQPVKSEAQLDGRTRQSTTGSNQSQVNRTKSTTSVQRHGGRRNYNRNSYYVACNYVVRTPHNRNWWRNRYNTTFVLFGGGYYYWWNNYWYPAYGYSPYYNNYIYSQPIYGYNNLTPGQVIQNVQLALRDQGYYPGAIDGLIGPQTRAALAAFQRDHGLIVTSAVDEPTLVTLGLT
jgi:Putative peptidoglycan binding domain